MLPFSTEYPPFYLEALMYAMKSYLPLFVPRDGGLVWAAIPLSMDHGGCAEYVDNMRVRALLALSCCKSFAENLAAAND